MKKLLLITLIILLSVTIIKHQKIKKYFTEQRYYKYLVNWHILKPCYTPHPDIEQIFTQEGFDYLKEDQKITADSLNKLENKTTKVSNTPKIPLITHHIYFSNTNSSKQLDVYFIEKMKTYYSNLNSLNDSWQHFIWTNNPSLFPAEVTNLKGVTIKSTKEFDNTKSYENLLDILHKAEQQKPYLSAATDLVRFLSVQKYGGIYCDMDYEVYDPKYLFELMHEFDFIGARETIRIDSFYASAFFAARPNHPVINDAIEKSYRNFLKSNAPEYIKYPCNIYDGILFNAPVLMTISYFAKNNIEGNNDIILPSWMALNVDFGRSKNQNCKLSKITKNYFYEKQNNLDQIIKNFMENPIVEEWQYTINKDNPSIYYNIDNHLKYKIIGSDPMCGTWITVGNHQKFHYLNW